MYTALHVFDFDGTIFGSPEPPEDWQGGWWSKPASLEYPHVPDKPGPEWYNTKVVSAAKRAVSDPSVLSILLTNRLDKPELRRRVTQLLRNVGIQFDEEHMAVSNRAFQKFDRIRQILAENPTIMELHVWEDSNHDKFRKFFTSLPDIDCELHVVPRFYAPTKAKTAAFYRSKKRSRLMVER